MSATFGAVKRLCSFAHTSRRFFWSAALACLLIVAAFLAIITLGLGGEKLITWMDDIGEAVGAAVAALACAVAACRTQGRVRSAWALIGASALSWAAGETAWSVYEVGMGINVPFPSAADIGFLAAIPFGVAGLLVFAGSVATRAERARLLSDGLLIAFSLLFVSWELVLKPIFDDSSLSAAARVISLAYPIGDVLMFAIVVTMLSRARENRAALVLVGAGVACLCVSDTAFTYLTAAGTYNGSQLDTGWLAGYLLIGLGSLRARSQVVSAPGAQPVGVARMLVPYFAFGIAIALGTVMLLSGRGLDRVAFAIAIFIASFGLVSQFLVQFENLKLLRATREGQRVLNQVIGNAPVALFSIDSGGHLTLATGKALHRFGQRAEQLVGKPVKDLLAAQPAFLAAIDEALEGRAGQLVANFDGGDLDIRLLPVLEHGRVTSVSGIAVDVSERRQAEEARRESEAKSRFLATMSHELRTPLNSVLGFAELLLGQRRGTLNEAQQRYVENISASGKHLLHLINEVLDLSRVAAGEVEVDLQPIAATDAIADAVAKIRPLADKKDLRLRTTGGSGVVLVADPMRFQQVVLNLLSNAVKFTPDGGRVEISIRREAHQVEIRVLDSGIGIAAENLEKIFDEYSQVDDSRSRNHEGTGLGLAVSRRLTTLMAGTLTVKSTLGKGSVFSLRLPAAQRAASEAPAGEVGTGPRPELLPAQVAGEPAS
ncbi:MAG: PAS domain S-box protein [Chloroflexi bacterium]|nr:MAG: PAS domain S-box protein [Chloroflexota bacterium]